MCIYLSISYQYINTNISILSIRQTNNKTSYVLIHIHNYIYIYLLIYIYYLNNFHTLNTPSDDHTKHTQDKHITYIYILLSFIICFLFVLYEHMNIYKPPYKLPPIHTITTQEDTHTHTHINRPT